MNGLIINLRLISSIESSVDIIELLGDADEGCALAQFLQLGCSHIGAC